MALSRSQQMSRIKDRDTRPERAVRALLWARGHRYRLRVRLAGARPDLMFGRARLAIFVDGCFWHGCPEHYALPRTRQDFWAAKLRENVERDLRLTAILESLGIRVLRFWAHEVAARPLSVVQRIEDALQDRFRVVPNWRVLSVETLANDNNRLHVVSLEGERATHVGPRNSNSITQCGSLRRAERRSHR